MSLIDALAVPPVKSKRKVDQLLAIISEEEQELVFEALRDTEKWEADTLARVLTKYTSVNVSASSVRRYRLDVLGMDK